MIALFRLSLRVWEVARGLHRGSESCGPVLSDGVDVDTFLFVRGDGIWAFLGGGHEDDVLVGLLLVFLGGFVGLGWQFDGVGEALVAAGVGVVCQVLGGGIEVGIAQILSGDLETINQGLGEFGIEQSAEEQVKDLGETHLDAVGVFKQRQVHVDEMADRLPVEERDALLAIAVMKVAIGLIFERGRTARNSVGLAMRAATDV